MQQTLAASVAKARQLFENRKGKEGRSGSAATGVGAGGRGKPLNTAKDVNVVSVTVSSQPVLNQENKESESERVRELETAKAHFLKHQAIQEALDKKTEDDLIKKSAEEAEKYREELTVAATMIEDDSWSEAASSRSSKKKRKAQGVPTGKAQKRQRRLDLQRQLAELAELTDSD